MLEFEVRAKDLLARIGRMRTKSGTFETPIFLPVINPSKMTVTPNELWEDFGCRLVITNAYIIKNNLGEIAVEKGVHNLLEFPGVVMTDSGAYQILAYGRVEVSPEEIISYQESIDTDIATILDIPTDWKVAKEEARQTVQETIKRATDLERLKSRTDISWVGPVQGGRHLDLVAESAKQMSNLPFDIHALGSPTPVMEQYLFDLMVDMILTAKMNLPVERPLHLFGAGHPFMFSLAVTLGCDMFDSAAYSLFARENRYLTERGTIRLENLEYLPCSCPICARRTAKELIEMEKEERERDLSRHNLYMCFSEIRNVKQAILEGRLWEHLEMRAHGHPSLLQALKHVGKYADYIERYSPIFKRKGLFFFTSVGLARPEVVRYEKRLFERYTPPEETRILVLVPHRGGRRSRGSRYNKRALSVFCEEFGLDRSEVHMCAYAFPFGVIPPEISDVYPVGQFECAYPPDSETSLYTAEFVGRYIAAMNYERSFMFFEPETWQEKIAISSLNISHENNINLEIVNLKDLLRKAVEKQIRYY